MNRKPFLRLLCFIALLLSLVLTTGCGTPDDSLYGASPSSAGVPAASRAEEAAEPSPIPVQPGQQSFQSAPDELPPSEQALPPPQSKPMPDIAFPDEDGIYTTAEDVALYLHIYGHLPNNFITKKQAQALGWPGGDLEPYAPGKCIGGSYFGNYQEQLPEKEGREYHECDIDTLGAKNRGAKRLVYSNDGLIYYTPDHYETFILLYGEPDP